LAKGLLFGAVMVLAPVGVWLAVHQFRGGRWLVSPVGWVVCVVVAAAWPVALLQQHPDALALWEHHTLGRLDPATAFNPKPAWYYLTTLPWQLLPWTLVMLPAVPVSLRRAWCEPHSADRWLWVWFVTLFVVLSAARGKHHHYLIYALPPAAVWAADALGWWRDRAAWLWGKAVWRWGATALTVVGIVAGALVAGRLGRVPGWEVAAVGAAVLVGMVLIGRACRRGNDRLAAAALFATVGGLLVYANAVWLDRTDLYRADAELVGRLNARTAPGEEVVIFTRDPARLLIDLERPAVLVKTADELKAACATRPGCHVLTVLGFDARVRAAVPAAEVDRTPRPRWANDPAETWLVVYRTAGK
jgi:4-amino-4-deoxy-L-arabinose transferase-like glycosyltransferase